MATNPADEYAAMDLFQKIYRVLNLQCRLDSLPWPSATDFSKQWLDVLFARDSLLHLQQLLSTRPNVKRICLDQIDRLSARGFPASLSDRLQKLKLDLTYEGVLLRSGSLLMSFSEARSTSETAPIQTEKILKESTFDDPKLVQELIADKAENLYQTSYCEPSESGETGDGKTEGTDLSNPLRLLQRNSRNKKKTGPPKKEYYRCQHIRALKKSIRQLQTGKFPQAAIHKVNTADSKQMQAWEDLKLCYAQHKSELDAVCDTVQGPLTDGKKKRKRNSLRTAARSYNNAYCSSFFASATVRAYNRQFCALVYSASPSEMCAKMKVLCCRSEHTSHCVTVWDSVHQYVRADMLRELGISLESK